MSGSTCTVTNQLQWTPLVEAPASSSLGSKPGQKRRHNTSISTPICLPHLQLSNKIVFQSSRGKQHRLLKPLLLKRHHPRKDPDKRALHVKSKSILLALSFSGLRQGTGLQHPQPRTTPGFRPPAQTVSGELLWVKKPNQPSVGKRTNIR